MQKSPISIDQYKMAALVDDILGLADQLGHKKFYIAGHDFGAMVSWSLALRSPERIKRMAIANVPHPAVFRSYLKIHPAQMLKSWYAMFFQIPGIPERFVKAANWNFLIGAMPEYWEEDQYNRYREAWAQPGAMTAMINWYRATFGRRGSPRKSNTVQPPTLIIWGKNDPHLSYKMAPLSLEFCQDGQLVLFEDATHWVQHDKAMEVSQLLIEHFQKE